MQFTGYHFPSDIILQAVRYYVAYKLSYRDIEEIFSERGIRIDHATINRWVIRFAPLIEQNARARKHQVSSSWRMDETYIKIKGKWWYYYRAVDKHGDIVDFYLSQTRNEKAAQALYNMNIQLWKSVVFMLNLIKVLDVKYLNNIVEQSHRPIKQKMRQALGWKSVEGAQATMSGQEVWIQLKRGQVGDLNLPVWERFYALAA
ncbi:IS6 family transposase [Photobacterium damselae]|uniref:IS6 family transposase n=1 Tax=Photobacterium damselae TaxID=38293 RepID=UPI00406836B0